jgi:hypothetical protein
MRQLQSQSENAGVEGGGWGANELTANPRGYVPHMVSYNLTGDQYIRDVLEPVVVPHFDTHPLATRPVYMDDLIVQEQ